MVGVSYINSGSSISNYGSSAFLNIYIYPTDVSANAVFLEWDVSSLDSYLASNGAGGFLVEGFVNATLYLYLDSFGGDVDYDVGVYGVSGMDVDASTVAWDFPWSVGGGMS